MDVAETKLFTIHDHTVLNLDETMVGRPERPITLL
jgi:hypothetical protein